MECNSAGEQMMYALLTAVYISCPFVIDLWLSEVHVGVFCVFFYGFLLLFYRVAQNKPDFSTFQRSLQKFAQNNAFNT